MPSPVCHGPKEPGVPETVERLSGVVAAPLWVPISRQLAVEEAAAIVTELTKELDISDLGLP
jgi:predicted RNase H-like nuclease (RuvC/YqgF family)